MSKLTKIIFNNNTFDLGKSRRVKTPEINQDVLEFVAKETGIVHLSCSGSFKDSLFLNGQEIVFFDLNSLTIPVNTGDSLTSDTPFTVVAFYEV